MCVKVVSPVLIIGTDGKSEVEALSLESRSGGDKTEAGGRRDFLSVFAVSGLKNDQGVRVGLLVGACPCSCDNGGSAEFSIAIGGLDLFALEILFILDEEFVGGVETVDVAFLGDDGWEDGVDVPDPFVALVK